MRTNEIFLSQQGEGPQVGMLAWFIRTSGCNLDCSYCDSKYAKDGKEMSIQEIKKSIDINKCKNIILTGGEPFIQKDLLGLLKSLADCNCYVETNGTIYNSNLIGYAKFIVSPKLEFIKSKYFDSLLHWKSQATFKFVIDNREDFDRAVAFCKKLGKLDDVYFMPQGITNEELHPRMQIIAQWIKDDAPFVWLSPRLQIYLWGNIRGK